MGGGEEGRGRWLASGSTSLASGSIGLASGAPGARAGAPGWWEPLVLAALGAFAMYFALAAAWIDWRGGSGYGPRLLLPALPGLALPLAAVLAGAGRRLRAVLAAAGVAGFTLAWCAALDPVRAFWDARALELLAGRPVVTVAGAVLGGTLAWRLLRRLPRHAVEPG